MIQFNDIKVHDLVYLDNNDSLDFDNDGEIEGWHIVTGVSKRVGFFTAAPLGDMDHSVYVDDMDMVCKHIRAAAVPGAIKVLEQIAAGEIAIDVESCDEKKNILVLRPERNEFGYEVVRIARNALRAVRGEE